MKKTKNIKIVNKSNKGITLIALVVTIIVLLLLAGISIQMLTGNNGILKRTALAKENTRAGTVIERIALAVSENTAIKYSTGTKNTKTSVIDELQREGYLETNEVMILQTSDTVLIGDILVDFTPLNIGIGDEVTATGLATFKDSSNNDIKWIYFGKDSSGNRLVTTKKPIEDGYAFPTGALEWLSYEDNINSACATLYANNGGTVGTARSITLEDINRMVGFTEPTFNKYTFIGGDTNKYEQGQVNYSYPSILGQGIIRPWNIASGFVTVGETLNGVEVPTEEFYCNAYYYYKDSSDGKYKLYWEGESKNWQEEETDRITIPNNMKYIVGEGNEFNYAVGSKSVQVRDVSADYYIAYVDAGCVGRSLINEPNGWICSGGHGGSMDFSSVFGSAYPYPVSVRPVVSLDSSVQLTNVIE